MLIFRGARHLVKFHLCSRNPLVALCVSDRSRCGAVLILISLAQLLLTFLRLGRLSLWRRARLSRFLEILEKRDLE